MLETRSLFIGLREALGRWPLFGIHINATRETCRQVMQVVNIQFFLTRVRKLEEMSGRQRCKRCEKCEGCGKCEHASHMCEDSSHMCEHTLRIKRGFSKVIKIVK